MRNTQERSKEANKINVIGKILVGFIFLIYLAYGVYLILAPESSHVALSIKLASMAIVVIAFYIFFRILSKKVQKIKELIGPNGPLKERDIERVEAGYAGGIFFLVYSILLLLVAELFSGIIMPFISKLRHNISLPALYIPRTEMYKLFIMFMIIGAIFLFTYPLTARSLCRRKDS